MRFQFILIILLSLLDIKSSQASGFLSLEESRLQTQKLQTEVSRQEQKGGFLPDRLLSRGYDLDQGLFDRIQRLRAQLGSKRFQFIDLRSGKIQLVFEFKNDRTNISPILDAIEKEGVEIQEVVERKFDSGFAKTLKEASKGRMNALKRPSPYSGDSYEGEPEYKRSAISEKKNKEGGIIDLEESGSPSMDVDSARSAGAKD